MIKTKAIKDFRTFEVLSETGMETLKHASIRIFDQLAVLAEKLSDDQYAMPLNVLQDNSIGKHYRHILEFYGVLIKGFRNGRVNYDSRRHDPELEISRTRCLEEIKKLKKQFDEPVWQEPLELSGSYSMESDEQFSVSTNAERELVYNIEHAIHHMAIIRIAVVHELPGIEVQDEFGYATSTLKYLRNQ
jgi:uncharacterized damage-inducible protein DinB